MVSVARDILFVGTDYKWPRSPPRPSLKRRRGGGFREGKRDVPRPLRHFQPNLGTVDSQSFNKTEIVKLERNESVRVKGGQGTLLDRLDDEIVAAGGRLYLAKDSRMDPRLLPAMYPRLPQFQAVRDRVDPHRHSRSDLSQRLGL